MLISLPAGLLPAVQQAPTLRHRTTEPPAPTPAPGKSGPASLPPDADGEYQFGETGEVIELYVEDKALRGYMVKRSEHSRAASTPLTYDFASGTAAGSAVSFTTRTLHGERYSFTGSLIRGPATSPSAVGYYLLRGQLTLHAGDASSTKSVVLERLGRH